MRRAIIEFFARIRVDYNTAVFHETRYRDINHDPWGDGFDAYERRRDGKAERQST